jgi:hypothetical protein
MSNLLAAGEQNTQVPVPPTTHIAKNIPKKIPHGLSTAGEERAL